MMTTQKESDIAVDKPLQDAPSRRPARRERKPLSGSLNLGSSVTSPALTRRAQDASLKSSFANSHDRRAGLAATKGRLSQSFIEQSGGGLDEDVMAEILKGFDDDDEKGEEGNGVEEIKVMQKPKRVGTNNRRNMLQSIESQKSMHFNAMDLDSEDDDR